MLLGMARGKVGELVFKRQYGEQITVPRVRNPKNPKTDSQMLTRIAFASASKTAQELRGIVDHSFQGIEYGQRSVNHFVSNLAKSIRSSVKSAVEDISTAPFGTAPILPLSAAGVGAAAQALISSGDLKSIPMSMGGDIQNGAILMGNRLTSGIDLSTLTLAQYEAVFGVPATDQVTIVAGVVSPLDYISESDTFYGVNFDWLRYNILDSVADTTTIFQAIQGQSGKFTLNPTILDMDRTDSRATEIVFQATPAAAGPLVVDTSAAFGLEEPIEVVLAGIIVSRYDGGVWRRNSCRLQQTAVTTQQSPEAFQQYYGYNDIASVLALAAPSAAGPAEVEYLNKEKKK